MNDYTSDDEDCFEFDKFKKCPGPPVKLRRSSTLSCTNIQSTPSPLCFSNHVALSPMYNPKKGSSYFEQIFDKLGSLGEGSFGKVYRVQSKEDRQIYAVKKLKSKIKTKDRYAEVINNEMIGYHPNIVQYFMAWHENVDTYIMLEYCDMSLADYSKCKNQITEELTWNVLYDMCQALHFLHSKQLIHLDVKPGNIMMKRGFYKLGDFGLLVVLENNKAKVTTLSDGDSKYLAIEVLEKIYTPFCDIFGLGITIIELATNVELPDHGPLWHKIRSDPLPDRINSRMSNKLKAIVQQMIATKYLQRPSAEEILANPTMVNISKRDKTQERTDFAKPYATGYHRQVFLRGSPILLNTSVYDKRNWENNANDKGRRCLFTDRYEKSPISSKDCCYHKPDNQKCEMPCSFSVYDLDDFNKGHAVDEMDIVSIHEPISISPVSSLKQLKFPKVKLFK